MNVNAVKNTTTILNIIVKRLRLSWTALSFSAIFVSIAINRFSRSASDFIDACISLLMLSFIRSIFSSILSIFSYKSSIRFSFSSWRVFNRSISRDCVCIKSSCMQSYSIAISHHHRRHWWGCLDIPQQGLYPR